MQREILVHDELEPCPYLDGQTARLPLRWQRTTLSPEELDAALARGERRVGRMLYRPTCPSCVACEPLRVPVAELVWSRSQRRVWKRNADLRVEVGPASYSDQKLALFNRHKLERGLAREERALGAEGYAGWFLRTCARTIETRYLLGDRLVGVGILDMGARDLSSVYFYFDPDEADRSLGTFSALYECEWLRLQGGRHYYLGLYVEQSRHVSYKGQYHPHERLIDGEWRRFEQG